MKTTSPSFSSQTFVCRSILAALALLLGLCPAVAQTTNTWNVNASSNWQLDSNWTPTNGFPNAVDAVAILGTVISANRTITNTSSITLGELRINDNNNYVITSPAGSTFTMDVTSGNTIIRMTNTGAANIGNGGGGTLSLQDPLDIDVSGSGTLTFNLPIGDFGPISLVNTGLVTFLGANGFNGNIVINNGGRLLVDADNRFGFAGNDLVLSSGARLFIRTNFTLGASRVIDVGTGGAILQVQTNGPVPSRFILGTAGQLTGAGTLIKTNGGRLTVNVPNTGFTGAVIIEDGIVELNNATGLGSAPNIEVRARSLTDASSFHQTVAAAPGSAYTVNSNAILNGNTAFFSSLTRGGNLTLVPGATIAETEVGAAAAITGLGTANDLIFGLGTNLSDSFTVGLSGGTTPWAAIATDGRAGQTRILSNSTITAVGDFFLLSGGIVDAAATTLRLGDGVIDPNFLTISAATVVTAYVASGTVQLEDANAVFTPNLNFTVLDTANLNLRDATALGGSGIADAGTIAGGVTVLSGGTLTINDSNSATAINASVVIRSNAFLALDPRTASNASTGLSGSGVITLENGAVVRLSGTGALTGPQMTPAAISAATRYVQLNAQNITNLSLLDPSLNYSVNVTQGHIENLNLNGGLLTTDAGANRAYSNGPAAIVIGPLGGTLAGARQFTDTATNIRTLVVRENITATGPLRIGSPVVFDYDGAARNGSVQFVETNFPNDNFQWVAGGLIFGETTANATSSNMDSAIIAGTLLTNLVVPDLGFLQFNLRGQSNSVVTVAQAVTFTGTYDPLQDASIVVRTNNAASNMVVLLTNVTLRNGAVLVVNEAGANVRMSPTLEGNATITDNATGDPFELLDLRASVPAAPRTLFLGLTNADAVFQIFTNELSIGDNFTLEQIRGGSRLGKTAVLGTGIVINNLGTNYTHPTAGQYIDGGLNVDIGRSGGPGVAASQLTVNLGSGQDLTVFVDEVTNAPAVSPFTNRFAGIINVFTNQSAVITGERGTNTDIPGMVIFETLNLSPGASVDLRGNNGTTSLVQTVNIAPGNAVLFSSVAAQARHQLGNVNNGFSELRIGGTNRITLNGTVSGFGSVVVTNGARFGGAGTVNGALLVADNARLEPGDAGDFLGILTMGDLFLNPGTTSIVEIAGNVAGTSYDQLLLTAGSGTTFLDGTLQLGFLNGFFPATSNDVLTIVTTSSGGITGEFASAPDQSRVSIIIAATNDIGSYRITYTGTQVRLDNWQYTTTDFDGDQITDSWARRYFNVTSLPAGTNATQFDGDADGDGVSNIGEFLAGTDPQDANSTFRITEVLAGPGSSATVRWVNNNNPMHYVSTYTIQYTDVLDTPYTNVVGATITFPAAGVAQWVDDGTLTGGTAPLNLPPPTRRVYRIRAE